MKALQFLQSERRLQLRDVAWPSISSPDDVIVRVAYAGVCGSDLHALSGSYTIAPGWLTMGHELSGVVAAMGADVTSVSIGDRVVVDPNRGCGKCEFCKLGKIHLCAGGGANDTLGMFRPGGWAEATVAPERCVHRLPDELPLSDAALCEPLSCLVHALDVFAVPEHGRVLILGAGIIGVLTACVLHHRGVRRVLISEPSAARRAIVEQLQLGFRAATPAELAAEFSAMSEAEVLTGGLNVVIDCSGVCAAIEQAAGWLRRGGELCLVGTAPEHGRVSLSPRMIVYRELTVKGSIIAPFTFPRATALALALRGRYLDFSKLGVEVFELEQDTITEAIEKLRGGVIAKAMFRVNGELE